MICKIAGTLILLLSGGYITLSLRRFERRRLRVLDGYISLLYYVKGQIDCYAMPIREILLRADPAVLADCLGLDSPDLPSEEPLPLPVMVSRSRLYLEPETERLLTAFTGELGTVYRAEQVARCDYYVSALTEARRKLFESMPARLRTASTLCICGVIGAAVLLW